jgi:hypothetical protein
VIPGYQGYSKVIVSGKESERVLCDELSCRCYDTVDVDGDELLDPPIIAELYSGLHL